MYFEQCKEILLSDTLVPDIFISDVLPQLSSDGTKVYIYCLFMLKYNNSIEIDDLSAILNISRDKIKAVLIELEQKGIIKYDFKKVHLINLKEREINRLYNRKTSSTPTEAISNSEKNIGRNSILSAINNNFFQGVMPPNWYIFIDGIYEKYKFDNDVVLLLFQQCYDNQALNKNYVEAVAQSWYSKNIRSSIELEKYIEGYQEYKKLIKKIKKVLRLNRNLTKYEEDIVSKWFYDYKYNFDVIEIALKKTTNKTNINFNYIDAIISNWNKQGLTTIADIEKDRIPKQNFNNNQYNKVPQKNNFSQREYDDDFFKQLENKKVE